MCRKFAISLQESRAQCHPLAACPHLRQVLHCADALAKCAHFVGSCLFLLMLPACNSGVSYNPTLVHKRQQTLTVGIPHGLSPAGSGASRPRPLERLSSAHSGDDSSGLVRGAVPGRPAGSIPLAAPGPTKQEEEVQEKVPAHYEI